MAEELGIMSNPYEGVFNSGTSGSTATGVAQQLIDVWEYTRNDMGFAVSPDGIVYNPGGVDLTVAAPIPLYSGAMTDDLAKDVLSMSVGLTTPDLQYDFDGDGNITSRDALAVKKNGAVDGTVAGGTVAGGTDLDLSNLATKTDLTAALAAVPQGYAAQPAVDLTGLGTSTNQNTMIANQGTMGTSLVNLGTGQEQAALEAAANQAKLIANQGTMGTGITEANTALGTLSSDLSTVQTGVNSANTSLGTLGTDMSTGFANADTQTADMQKAVLGGQTTMSNTLKTIGDNANTYYGDLSSGQTTLTDNVGTVQDDLNTLRTDQSDSNTLADIARAELANTVTGGFDTVTAAQKTASDTASLRNTALQGQLQATSANNAANTFSQAATQISQGTATGQNTSQQDFVNRLASVRNIIATQAGSLDPAVLAQYTTLADGFDAQGKLVQQSVDANGNTLRRGITEQGMLVTNTYNAQGALSNQTNSDINTLIMAVQPTGQFGDLSASGGGLMSASSAAPYSQ